MQNLFLFFCYLHLKWGYLGAVVTAALMRAQPGGSPIATSTAKVQRRSAWWPLSRHCLFNHLLLYLDIFSSSNLTYWNKLTRFEVTKKRHIYIYTFFPYNWFISISKITYTPQPLITGRQVRQDPVTMFQGVECRANLCKGTPWVPLHLRGSSEVAWFNSRVTLNCQTRTSSF